MDGEVLSPLEMIGLNDSISTGGEMTAKGNTGQRNYTLHMHLHGTIFTRVTPKGGIPGDTTIIGRD